MDNSAPSDPLRTGFIGLGNQGTPMAACMVRAGFALTVWARRAEVARDFANKGASVAANVAELGASCDYVGICVVNDDDVAQVCEQLIPSMREGSVLAIHSTILPQSCEELEARCAQRGILFLDAPVSGGAPVAEKGELTLMCGGTQEAFNRAKPVLDSFGKLIVHLGGAGAGQRAKIVNNALMAANMGVARAAVSAAKSLGLEKDALAEIINHSSGRSLGFEVYARLRQDSDFAVGTPLLIKDVGLLSTILDGDDDSEILRQAADFFLGPASAG